ncbi:MAG TPA: NAD(P)/FAD-dependent oxidoreductase [Thermoanaerobaculia bacterium]|nr:NAD(P)/FAD-dependent oxidoreductase [Thermoanaerobaculia bacterium]
MKGGGTVADVTSAERGAEEGAGERLMAGAALGVPAWAIVSLVLLPLLSGGAPQWDADAMRARLPQLTLWVLAGGAAGLLAHAAALLAPRISAGARVPAPAAAPKRRVVILGGGFAGLQTAATLEHLLRGDPSVSITLVSETNALLFTPMLAEVAGSSLEASHISTPLRTSLGSAEFVRARVASIDVEGRRVLLASDAADAAKGMPVRELPFDHLVLALGSVSNYFGQRNVEEAAFDFKSLLDAIRIRNHVIEMFERADRESDAASRRALLTFVVAGGGFAGVELAGALNDFCRGILADYPGLPPEELSVVLVHSRDRILPELSESLGRYARESMEARGVTFRLQTRLVDARPGVVVLSDGELRAETLVWTAGVAPSPLLATLPFARDKRGAVVVESTMAVPGQTGIWAVGDAAALMDGRTGKPCPPTAQFAIREGAHLARNIQAALSGKAASPFHFESLGALCVVGHQTACAELAVPFFPGRSVRFSGLLAWLMWRGIYLSKLPGLERKVRVLVDWTIELFFPRDIVQTIELS